MSTNTTEKEQQVYLELLVKALRGVRSSLRATYPERVEAITELIEMPKTNEDETQMFLIKAHSVILDGRNSVFEHDPEAGNLLDAIHNIPHGLLGRFDGGWDWKESLPDILFSHEKSYLNGFQKYSGMLKYI